MAKFRLTLADLSPAKYPRLHDIIQQLVPQEVTGLLTDLSSLVADQVKKELKHSRALAAAQGGGNARSATT